MANECCFLIYIYIRERDTALEVEAQLYNNNIVVEYNASKSKRKCKAIEPAKYGV